MRVLITHTGEERELPSPVTMGEIADMIGAGSLDTVALRSLGPPLHVMVVDDLGHSKKLPLNEKATHLYWQQCGGPVTHAILGDVVIVPDDDYA